MEREQASAEVAGDVGWIEDEPLPDSCLAKAPPIAGETEFTIGELSREFGVTLRALRFYEAKGFVTPRRQGTMRLYGQGDRARIAAILTGKKLGFTLTEIRAMIFGQDGARSADSLRVTREKCLEQIRSLEKEQLHIGEALAELRRIHAGLSAETATTDPSTPLELVPSP